MTGVTIVGQPPTMSACMSYVCGSSLTMHTPSSVSSCTTRRVPEPSVPPTTSTLPGDEALCWADDRALGMAGEGALGGAGIGGGKLIGGGCLAEGDMSLVAFLMYWLSFAVRSYLLL